MPKSKIIKSYWVYDIINNEFYYNISSKQVTKLTGVKSHHIWTVVDKCYVVNDTWMIWDNDKSRHPSAFKHHIAVPNVLIAKVVKQLQTDFANKVYMAYRSKYLAPNQLIRIDDKGNEVETFDSYEECANSLKLPIGTVKSQVHRILNRKSLPNSCICKRKDYAEVIRIFFPSKGNGTI